MWLDSIKVPVYALISQNSNLLTFEITIDFQLENMSQINTRLLFDMFKTLILNSNSLICF